MFGFLKKSADAKGVATDSASLPEPASAPPQPSWRERLKAGLARTRAQFGGKLKSIFSRGKVDDELLEELETLLLTSDVGMEATQHLLDELKTRARRDKLDTPEGIQQALSAALIQLLLPLEQPLEITSHRPFIIMIAGVNGAGKTTSIGKLAKYFHGQGLSVLLAAGDTFRAAAREQLQAWGERNEVTVISQQSGDPAAVIFDAIAAARARGIDIVLADTAGRLPTQLHLMEEIAKVRRVIQKADPSGPHETLLVLDANFGQNALQQVKAFDKSISVTGLVVTKLDGSAKGGVIAAIARQCPKPIRFIGIGEGIDDLRPFVARDFVDALFEG
ncbi:MAG: signal recognition particle-docking protein FtsY [Propionivibrio sp.]|uniref:signal recognition particle-docking protein FtsY n=1 Tax=Propionivibrio sp. TaxID=2212460 RepID=UPI001A6068CB|nr:signal recognition particle-docking protein FtsY [Propionivibrio sp.]MBL8414554.1 signal recognition particle-docking protein FtsY [Propionivibrio sp.]